MIMPDAARYRMPWGNSWRKRADQRCSAISFWTRHPPYWARHRVDHGTITGRGGDKFGARKAVFACNGCAFSPRPPSRKNSQGDERPPLRLRWRSLVKELQFRQILTPEAARGLFDVIPLLDQASRSEEYSKEVADLTIETGPKLIAGLQDLARAEGAPREFLSGKRSDRPPGVD